MSVAMNTYVARLQEIMASDTPPIQALRDLRVAIQAMGELVSLESSEPELARAWSEGWLACEDYKDAWVAIDMPENPYRSES